MSVRVVPWKPEMGPDKWRVDIRFKKPDGTKVRNQTVHEAPTKGMARKWGEARESQLRAGTLAVSEEKAEIPSFATFVLEWETTYPKAAGNRHTTTKEKATHIKSHLLPYFGSMRLDEINEKAMDAFLAHMADKTKGKPDDERVRKVGTGKKTLKPKTRRNVMMTLRKILATAEKWGQLPRMPRFPRIKVPECDFDFYDVHEAAQLVRAAGDAEERAMLLFALHTGARAGELLAVEWTSIDTRQKLVSFSRSTTKGVTSDTTKSGKPRRVPLSAPLEAILKAVKHLKSSLVFCKPDGSAHNLDDLHRVLARAQKRAGLRAVRWHDLRHSYASNLTIGGTPIRQVQEWMGHSTITMTMRYAHLAPTEKARKYLTALDVPEPAKGDVAAE
jgi:integrase